MDDSNCHGGNSSDNPLHLIYPISVEFNRRKPQVNLCTLTVGVLNPEHLCEPRQTGGENDVFLYKSILSIPWKYNLYILVNAHEEAYNVNFITILLCQAFDVHRSLRPYREKYRGAYKEDVQYSEHDGGQISRKRKSAKPTAFNPCKKKALSAYSSETVSQENAQDDDKTKIKLTLALRDVETSITSLYDFLSLFGERFDYERCQYDPTAENDSLSDNQRQSITKEPPLQFKRTNNLYVCSFNHRDDFQMALDYLTKNCANWSNVYDMPVGLEDDCLRFSLDMFIHNVQVDREIQLRQRRQELITGTGLRSSALTPLANLKIDDPSLLLNNNLHNHTDGEFSPEILLEYAFTTGFKCSTTAVSSKMAHASGGISSRDNKEENSQKKRIDIFSGFSTANWSIYNSNNNLVTNIDRQAFERLLIKSHPTFFQSLSVPFAKPRFDQLYDTPLLFVPSIIWDIETIAHNPCSIPRGVADDEALVSIALVIERPTIDAFRLAIVWVLVPDCLDDSERDRIAKQSLLRIEREHNLHASPTLICYSDERAMLYDFCALMIINFPLLYSYMGISPQYFSVYHDLCAFLIGHNSVGYDYAFILNRCLFFGFDDLRRHLTRKMTGTAQTSGEISVVYTFNDAQICIDTLLFLRARMRHLNAFDLRSVLRYYHCEITKLDLDAVQIRHFYNSLYRQSNNTMTHTDSSLLTTKRHYAAQSAQTRLSYFTAFLRYNVFDCLSLCDLLTKLSFVQYLTTLMRCFSVPLESAMYRGNSRLLPSILINDCLREKQEFLVSTHENQSIFSIDRCGLAFINEFHLWLKERSALPASSLAISFEYHRFLDCITPAIPAYHTHHIYNPYIEFVEYMRTICWTNSLHEKDNAPLQASSNKNPTTFHENSGWQLDPNRFYSFSALSLPCDRQLDLLRIGEKTYIGGMNYADPCHVKHPILMDYNSFYPSVIRHYQLDVNNVAVFTVKKLLLAIRPIVLLEEIIKCHVFRLFDYTALSDVDIYVNRWIFSSPHFQAIFTPKPHSRREWHEGIEIDSLDLLLASSRSLERRVLVLIKKIDGSVIDRVVTQALCRRNEWKKKKRENPNDKMIQSRELMDKLLANGTYGYLNYCKSVTFSRATAAAVTLLCRNTFYRTRFIIESDALLLSLNLDPNVFSARVIYIDTDGCIVFMQKKCSNDSHQDVNPLTTLFTALPSSYGQKGLRIALPCFKLSSGNEDKIAYSSSKFILGSTQDLSQISTNKDRFVEQVNKLLNMKYIKLATEHHQAVAASVFATKKYALYNVDNLYPPSDSIKKTGFESNAALPIKSLYDLVLRNISLLNHGYNLVHAERFICKIVRHRAFFYAIFDKLYQWWQEALIAHQEQAKLTQKRIYETNAEEEVRNPTSFKLVDFATRIPLNPKETKGKMAEFIDRVLHEFKYDIGDRVRILKLAPIDSTCSTLLETPEKQYLLYDVTDTHFELFDVVQEKMDNVLPDFKYFLGGHAIYLYQCIEGCQTLRDRSSCQCEPIEWSTTTAFLHHLHMMKKEGYVSGINKAENSSTVADITDKEENTLFLRSFNAIYDLNYATWLWQRILSKRIDRHWHDRVLLLWNSHIKTDMNKIRQAAHDNSAAFQQSLSAGMASKNLPCAPPKMLSAAFFKKWLTNDSQAIDKIVFDTLFTEPDTIASQQDIASKKRLITSGALLYKHL